MSNLSTNSRIHVQQKWEGWEIVLPWESRNKYKILDQSKNPLMYAAEQSKGISGRILRQFVGHWRSFSVTIFDNHKRPMYQLEFPFRWFFKTLHVKTASGRRVGHAQQRFAFLRKKFDLFDEQGQLIARINSSFFRFWTFEIFTPHKTLATIQKKWSGALSEIFTDRDNFVVTFNDPSLSENGRALAVSVCLMVDIIYFENNQGKNSLSRLFD